MVGIEHPALETARLVLRPFHATDAPEVMRMAGDRAVASTTLDTPYPNEPGMAEAWIATHQVGLEQGRLQNFAIERKEDRILVGSIGLVIAPAHRRAELGYWIGREHWNRGYATEAARAVVRHGFETLGLNRIITRYLTRNPASGRVLAKAGLVHEGRLRQHVLKWDEFEDLELYGRRGDDVPPA